MVSSVSGLQLFIILCVGIETQSSSHLKCVKFQILPGLIHSGEQKGISSDGFTVLLRACVCVYVRVCACVYVVPVALAALSVLASSLKLCCLVFSAASSLMWLVSHSVVNIHICACTYVCTQDKSHRHMYSYAYHSRSLYSFCLHIRRRSSSDPADSHICC